MTMPDLVFLIEPSCGALPGALPLLSLYAAATPNAPLCTRHQCHLPPYYHRRTHPYRRKYTRGECSYGVVPGGRIQRNDVLVRFASGPRRGAQKAPSLK